MTYTEEEERTAAREALDWCAERHGTLSAFIRYRDGPVWHPRSCAAR